VALKYVDPSTRYPPGWFVDGTSKIEYSNASLQSTWQAFEDLQATGLAKSIGVSNYTGALLLDLFTYAKVLPATLQIEHHPYYVQPHLITLAQQHGISVTAYSSFGPQGFIECDMKIAADTPVLFEQPVIKQIAEKYGKSPAQVLLRWSTQRGISVIPKSNSEERMRQNLDVSSFDLEEGEMRRIGELDLNLKFNAPTNVSFLLSGKGALLTFGTVWYSLLCLCVDFGCALRIWWWGDGGGGSVVLTCLLCMGVWYVHVRD
jgi:D-xylose reductase